MLCPRCNEPARRPWQNEDEGCCDLCGLTWKVEWEAVERPITDDEKAVLRELRDPPPPSGNPWVSATGYLPGGSGGQTSGLSSVGSGLVFTTSDGSSDAVPVKTGGTWWGKIIGVFK